MAECREALGNESLNSKAKVLAKTLIEARMSAGDGQRGVSIIRSEWIGVLFFSAC